MEATNGSPQPGVRLGTRVDRVPSKPVEREADGRYALHLWLQHEGKFGGDLALRLSPAEAESLHAQLCYALDGEAARRRGGDRCPSRRRHRHRHRHRKPYAALPRTRPGPHSRPRDVERMSRPRFHPPA